MFVTHQNRVTMPANQTSARRLHSQVQNIGGHRKHAKKRDTIRQKENSQTL